MDTKIDCEKCLHFEEYTEERHLLGKNNIDFVKKGTCKFGKELLLGENTPKSGKCELFEPI